LIHPGDEDLSPRIPVMAALVERNDARSNQLTHKSMVVESSA
jgi:hypothetical protein